MTHMHSLAAAIRKAVIYTVIPTTAAVTMSAFAEQLDQDMETITVTAQALKVQAPAQETPKSISIVTEEDLKLRAPQKIDEALRYTSGVTAQPYGSDNDNDWFFIRGFQATSYLDGNRLYGDGYYHWLIEPYALESVEVLKGPSAILYGEAAPGGLVNMVQKKPTYTPQGEIQVQLGSNDLASVGFDIADNANDDGTMRYRLVGQFKKADGEIDYTENERIYLAPSLEIDLSEQTTLTLLASYLKDDGIPVNPFKPVEGTLVSSPNGKIAPSTNLGEPDYDTYQRTQISTGYILDHELNDTWTLSQNLNYGYNDLKLISTYIFPADWGDDKWDRGVVYQDGTNQSITLDNHAVGNWYANNTEHTLLVGLDLQYHQVKGVEETGFAFGLPSPVNPWNPTYGNYQPLTDANLVDRKITKHQSSVYSQYQIKFDSRIVGLIGGRYDYIDIENTSQKASERETLHDGQLSLNAGIMYLADNGLSPYVSYSESFEAFGTLNNDRKLYQPRESEQVEVGIKYEPEFFDGYMNLAWFDITNKNALSNSADSPIQSQSGEQTAKGVEFEVVGNITENTNIAAAYTYTDAKMKDKANGTNTPQYDAALIPEQQITAWINYDARGVGISGLRLGTGVRYIGESSTGKLFWETDPNTQLTVSSATLWDLAVTYDITRDWQAQLNVNNVFDKEYISGCDTYCYYGQSRSVTLNANYSW